MPFEQQIFAAKIALGMIHPEDMPSSAQNALVAGYDGPWIRRMAGLEKPSGWETDQVLPGMLADLEVQRPTPEQAAIQLATAHVIHIQQSGEDPLMSLGYYHELLVKSGYPRELEELGWIEEDFYGNEQGFRASVAEAMENLLNPELAERRRTAITARVNELRQEALKEWPYVLNSPTGRNLFKQRWREKITDLRILMLWVVVPAALLVGWSFRSWKFAVLWPLGMIPYLGAMSAFGVYREMKRERQTLRWRNRLDL